MRRRPSWQLWSLGLLLLLLSACLAQGTGQAKKQEDDRIKRVDSAEGVQKPLESGRKTSSELSPVEEALAILRPLQSSRNAVSRFSDRPRGVVDITLYYAKKTFFFLFMNGSPPDPLTTKLRKPFQKATEILSQAAQAQDADAIHLLAELNFHGNFTYPRNFPQAFQRYKDLAALNGNASAQHMLGFMYATGVGESVNRDQAKSLLYHTFAAKGGDIRAQMTVAYRHHAGVGTPRDCNEAALYYKRVADKAIEWSRNGPPGGRTIERPAYRVADEIGGVYGEGASVVSSGPFARKGGPSSDQHASFDDVLEYLDLMSRKGDLSSTFSLGKLHYDGTRHMRRSFKAARRHFLTVARTYWAKDGSKLTEDMRTAKLASKAAGYLGRMFLRGEGTEQSFEKAMTWFKRGLANGDSLCQYQIGLMHLEGLGVRQDAVVAADYLKEAANQDFASAQVRLGQLFLDQGDVVTARNYFRQSASAGHIEAFYHLAEMNNYAIGQERSCEIATVYYKGVSEQVETLHSSFEEANRAYEDGDYETALISYMMAAEQGYEAAQANVAYLLDEFRSILPLDVALPWKRERTSLLRNSILALTYWTRSAKQSNIDSLLKMGDYYLAGNGAGADVDKAALCYQTAAETHHSAQALWNLGWIHENGMGVEQDFHLAKRFYDQSLETNQESYLPVKMALVKLRFRSFWNTITHGKANSIRSEPGKCFVGVMLLLGWTRLTPHVVEESKPHEWTLHDFLAKFTDPGAPYSGDGHPGDEDEFIDGSLHDGMPGGDEMYDDLDSDLVESAIIIGLVATLALLVYYRNQRQAGAPRQEPQPQPQQQAPPPPAGPIPPAQEGPAVPALNPAAAPGPLPGQQADGGFFPPPGDPQHGPWVAGGVGH